METIKIDLSMNLENVFNTLVRTNKEVILHFCFKEEELNKENGKKIINFLNKLNSRNIKFKVSRPLPKCLFSTEYNRLVRKFNIPQDCFECEDLFTADNNKIKSCGFINKEGPKTCYMAEKKQIAEFFKILKSLKSAEKCKACSYFKRDLCGGLC